MNRQTRGESGKERKKKERETRGKERKGEERRGKERKGEENKRTERQKQLSSSVLLLVCLFVLFVVMFFCV